MTRQPVHLVLCNGATAGSSKRRFQTTRLEYRSGARNEQNIVIGLPPFIGSLGTVPERVLDLIELASYVYCADRRIGRGSSDSLEYSAWSRRLLFRVKVRDRPFWSGTAVQAALRE